MGTGRFDGKKWALIDDDAEADIMRQVEEQQAWAALERAREKEVGLPASGSAKGVCEGGVPMRTRVAVCAARTRETHCCVQEKRARKDEEKRRKKEAKHPKDKDKKDKKHKHHKDKKDKKQKKHH